MKFGFMADYYSSKTSRAIPNGRSASSGVRVLKEIRTDCRADKALCPLLDSDALLSLALRTAKW
jgi:hypothetical protein